MKRFSLLAVLCLAVFTFTGCVRFKVSSISFDPESKNAVTNQFSGMFFCAKTTAEKIEVAVRTKTTSKLFGAKNTETTGDVEMVKAISDALGNAVAAGAKAAVKP